MKILKDLINTYTDDKQNKDLLVVRYFYRPLSFPLTVPFIQLRISANQVTLINFIILVVSSLMIATGKHTLIIIGAIIYFFIFVMDCIDGNIARYTRRKTYLGKLTDGFVDALVYLIFVFVAIGNIRSGKNILPEYIEVLNGAIIAVSMLAISFFRAKLSIIKNEIAYPGISISNVDGILKGRRISIMRAGLSIIQNLGVISPILYMVALLTASVSYFLLFYAIMYLTFTVAEVLLSLVKYYRVLSISRP